jgi:hypothetical protein
VQQARQCELQPIPPAFPSASDAVGSDRTDGHGITFETCKDRGRTKSAVGKSAEKQRRTGQSYANSWEADALIGRTEEDCRGAKGEMGEGEGGEENGLGK